jgi:hypothetical protein
VQQIGNSKHYENSSRSSLLVKTRKAKDRADEGINKKENEKRVMVGY